LSFARFKIRNHIFAFYLSLHEHVEQMTSVKSYHDFLIRMAKISFGVEKQTSTIDSNLVWGQIHGIYIQLTIKD
jgi:hypothetical protein